MLLNKNDIETVKILSNCENDYVKYILLLKNEYGYNLTKNELAKVLRISEQTIDRRIKDGTNIPKFKRSSNSKKASYLFSITSVAHYLVNTNKNNQFEK